MKSRCRCYARFINRMWAVGAPASTSGSFSAEMMLTLGHSQTLKKRSFMYLLRSFFCLLPTQYIIKWAQVPPRLITLNIKQVILLSPFHPALSCLAPILLYHNQLLLSDGPRSLSPLQFTNNSSGIPHQTAFHDITPPPPFYCFLLHLLKPFPTEHSIFSHSLYFLPHYFFILTFILAIMIRTIA